MDDALDEARPTAVVRRHREDKHRDPLKNPTLVRRYDRRMRAVWRHRRRDAKHGGGGGGGAAEADRETTEVAAFLIPPPHPEWEMVVAPTPPCPPPNRQSWVRTLLRSWFG